MLRYGFFAVMAIIVLIAAGEASAADGCASPPRSLGNWQEPLTATGVPDQPWFDEQGRERRFAEFKGKALVVNLWATWCLPCVKEMPALDQLRAAVAADGIEVLPVSADREGASVVRKFYDVNQLKNLPVVLDRKGRIARALTAPVLPTTVLFDADGREVGRVIGEARWDARDAVAFLRRCLKPAGGAT